MKKTFLGLVLSAAFLFVAVYAFNHINPWLAIGFVLVTIYFLINKIEK